MIRKKQTPRGEGGGSLMKLMVVAVQNGRNKAPPIGHFAVGWESGANRKNLLGGNYQFERNKWNNINQDNVSKGLEQIYLQTKNLEFGKILRKKMNLKRKDRKIIK